MPFTLGKAKNRFRFVINPRHVIVLLLLATFASVASAQLPNKYFINDAPCTAQQAGTAIYPSPEPLVYPRKSGEYAVQYLDNGSWKDETVYISKYGGTNSSPHLSYSGYTKSTTSLSFVSVPVRSDATVMFNITLKSGSFHPTDGVSIRPSAKGIAAEFVPNELDPEDGTVQISTTTGADFQGEQFILWWNRDANTGGGIQGLAFFLNPTYEYEAPKSSATTQVQVVRTAADLSDIPDNITALDIEGTKGKAVAIEGTYGTDPAVVIEGAGVLDVPPNINTIFLGPDAWVQGKLVFESSGPVKIYGPGVLDVSRFQYNLRGCGSTTDYAAEGYYALSSPTGQLTNFTLDGVIISDTNHAANDLLYSGTVNNVKTIGWNAENGGLRLDDGTTASNVFVRSGDDSLMVWGSDITVTNATVWQNYNGGVVNLGWLNDSPGDNDLINGLSVVKTDWITPAVTSWCADPLCPVPLTVLNDQNNAVIASLMLPGTKFGKTNPSLFENIFVEETPRVFLSLKILPTNCAAGSTRTCPAGDLTQKSVLNLNIQNVFTPPSTLQNSIGFQTLPPGYKLPTGCVPMTAGCQSFPDGYILTGSMSVSLMNFWVVEGSTATALTGANAESLGQVTTNGDNVTVTYNPFIKPPPPPLCKQYTCM